MEQEWEVIFQADMTGVSNYVASDIDTDAKTAEVLCDIQRTASSNMHANSKYSLGAAGGRRL